MSAQGKVLAVQSDIDPNRANVYDGIQLVATLRHQGGGWRTVYYLAEKDESGFSTWAKVGDDEPLPLDDAAARAAALANPPAVVP
jgi:hypothetical protein